MTMMTRRERYGRCNQGVMFAVVATLLSATGGCSVLRAGTARQQYINQQTQEHVYRQPITRVWPEVRKLLFEKGFQAKDSDTGSSFSLETESQTVDGKTVRYLVQGVKVEDSACRVEFTKMTSGPSGTGSNRDLEIEWQLLQRVDANSAQQIKTAAEAEGEKAKTQS